MIHIITLTLLIQFTPPLRQLMRAARYFRAGCIFAAVYAAADAAPCRRVRFAADTPAFMPAMLLFTPLCCRHLSHYRHAYFSITPLMRR